MDAVVATDSWLVVVCVTVVATDSWLVVVYAMASVCCSQRSNRMRGVSARCVVCSGGLHASHQRHVPTSTVHVGARGRACQRRNSAPRAPPMKRAAAAWSLVPLALPAALRRRPRSMDQVCSSSPPLVSARDCLLGWVVRL